MTVTESGIHHEICLATPTTTISRRTGRRKSTSSDPDRQDATAQFLKILLAEDDNISRLFLARVLGKLGHQVKSVKNGKEVLQELQTQESYDVLLTDIQMPEIDGVELTKILRTDNRFNSQAHLPIIAMTAYAMRGDRERFLSAGADEYLPKPIDGKLLHIILDHIANGAV